MSATARAISWVEQGRVPDAVVRSRIRPPVEWRECFTLEEAVADAPPGQDVPLEIKRRTR